MSDDGSDFWFCANADGSLKTVERQELLANLQQGALTGQSLVWRQGWAEWLAAGQVAELSSAVPAFARGTIITPKADPDRTYPPPVPVRVGALEPIVPVASSPVNDRPGTLVMQEVELTGSDLEPVKPPPPSRASAPPAPSRRGAALPPRPASSAPKASSPDKASPPQASWVEVASPTQVTAAEPTITDLSKPKGLEPIVPVDSSPHHEPVTGMLADDEIQIVDAAAGAATKAKVEKPPASLPSLDGLAAMVEAKKPRPAPMIAISKPAAPVPAATPLAPVIVPLEEPVSEGPTQLADAIIPVSDPDNEAPTQIHPAALRPDAPPLPAYAIEEAVPLPAPPEPAAWQTPAPAAVAPAYAPQAAQYPSYAPPKKKSALPLIIGGLGLLGLVGALGAGALIYFKPWESVTVPTAKPSATQATSAAPAPVAAAPVVTITKEATRLSPAIQLNVPPYLSVSGGKVLVGFAASEVAGLGLAVDLGSLEVEQVFSAPAGKKVIGVVPVASEKERFLVDREGVALGLPHSVDAEPAFTVGFSGKGYARQPKGGAAEELWSDVTNDKATEARVASVDGVGHAVTFRNAGKVRVGWLKPNGSKKSELGSVETEGRAGTPTVAAGDQGILVAFAAKSGDDSPWNVQLASAKHGELPTASKSFTLPSGGPGGDAIAPVAAGLPDGRWLLQWTEGGAGERVVRVQILGADLAPLGDALRVSAAGKEAGQGVIAVAGDKAASFQLVKGDKGYELWGTALGVK
ncbi:MAG: hypothetical protein AMXMBFR56_00230 [Polyangiaceae bacterium]